MDRIEAELLIPDFVAGRLDAARRDVVARELARSAELRLYRDAVERFYRLDLDLAVIRRPRRPRVLTRIAAAAVILLCVAAWMTRRDLALDPSSDGGGAEVSFAPMRIALPELPAHDGGAGWAVDALEARLISEFTGKPILVVYSFPPCPRCRAMEPVLDSPPMHDRLAGFARYRVDFVEEIPTPLVMRQFEVEHSIVLHLPAIVITRDGVDFDTLYDIDAAEDVSIHAARFEATASTGPILEGAAFARARDLLIGARDRLAAGDRNGALIDLDRVEELAAPSGSRFASIARDLRRRIEEAERRDAR